MQGLTVVAALNDVGLVHFLLGAASNHVEALRLEGLAQNAVSRVCKNTATDTVRTHGRKGMIERDLDWTRPRQNEQRSCRGFARFIHKCTETRRQGTNPGTQNEVA